VKYMLLIYSNPAWRAMSEQERDQVARDHATLYQALVDSGELVSSEELADPETTRTVRLQGGVPAVTDGPFAEAKEHLAGYYLVECDSLERAVEIATRVPDARYNAVELRPVMNSAGMEM
jgi:hypothetical protein